MDGIEPHGRVGKRVVLHFPGFEPLDAGEHRERYRRTIGQTAELWGFSSDVGPLVADGAERHFDVESTGRGWTTRSRIHVLDHQWLVERLAGRSLAVRLWRGFLSAARVTLEGGALGYLRHAWRFWLFFIVPFLVTALALAASLAVATYPWWLGLPAWNYVVGLLLGWLLFRHLFLPWSARYHLLHLFSDWEMAVAVARLDDPALSSWLETCAARVRTALGEAADEYLITSHSMGSSVAVHVVGMLLEREPRLFEGKRVVFVTLGGAVLQCALLRSAAVLRSRVGLIARAAPVRWIEVQCMTDVVNFHRSRVASICGHADAPQPSLVFIHIKRLLSTERYRRIRRDLLRVHRQYVLAADRRAPFDFSLMTAGPLAASAFVQFTRDRLPDIDFV